MVGCWCEVPVLGCAQQPGRSQAGKSTACREAMEQQAESQKVRKTWAAGAGARKAPHSKAASKAAQAHHGARFQPRLRRLQQNPAPTASNTL